MPPTTHSPLGITLRAYRPDRDFLRIRDFLAATYARTQRPFNWLIDRWNFCRYFAAPVHSYYNVRYFSVPTRPHPAWRDEVAAWEQGIGVWETSAGDIVGVVHAENEGAGEAWCQIDPAYTHLYPAMVDYAETYLADRAEGMAFVKLYVVGGSGLETVAQARGYRPLPESANLLRYPLGALPAVELPPGYVIRSVAEEDDVDRRRAAKSIAFGGGYAPSDWPPAAAMRSLQAAPDYRADLDLILVAPNGEYATFCTIWLDAANRYANFEPVGTLPDYRGQGLARALLHEGFRRMAAHGVQVSYMAADNAFYRRLGFVPTDLVITPWIRYF